MRLQDWKQEFQGPHHSPGPAITSEPQLSYLENQYKSDLHLSEHTVRLQCLWSVLRFWIRDRAVSWCCLASNEHYISCRMEYFWTVQLLQSLKCKNYHMQKTRHRHLKEKIYCSTLNKCVFSPAIFHSIISWNFLIYEVFLVSPFISLHSPPPLPSFFVGLKKILKNLKSKPKDSQSPKPAEHTVNFGRTCMFILFICCLNYFYKQVIILHSHCLVPFMSKMFDVTVIKQKGLHAWNAVSGWQFVGKRSCWFSKMKGFFANLHHLCWTPGFCTCGSNLCVDIKTWISNQA